MSFGLSITDLVALPKLAWDLYSALKDAPDNHTALSDETMLALLHSLDEYAIDTKTLTLWQHTAIRVLDRKRATMLLDLQEHFPVFQIENVAGIYDFTEGSSAKMAEIVIQVQTYNDLVSTFIREAASRGQLVQQQISSGNIHRCGLVKQSYQPPQELVDDTILPGHDLTDYTVPGVLLGYQYA
ncbi:MAG: hypothetical protein Q9181_007237 [Wetmoreana brouardii]